MYRSIEGNIGMQGKICLSLQINVMNVTIENIYTNQNYTLGHT
jgi:hypothetical protein